MDAYQKAIVQSIGHGGAIRQRNEIVARAGHNCRNTGLMQSSIKTLSDIEGEFFFHHPVEHGSRVLSTMTRINHDNGKSLSPRGSAGFNRVKGSRNGVEPYYGA